MHTGQAQPEVRPDVSDGFEDADGVVAADVDLVPAAAREGKAGDPRSAEATSMERIEKRRNAASETSSGVSARSRSWLAGPAMCRMAVPLVVSVTVHLRGLQARCNHHHALRCE